MSNFVLRLCAAMSIFVCCGYADAPEEEVVEVTTLQNNPAPKVEVAKVEPKKEPIKNEDFQSFTGKIVGKKVRMRLQPSLESYIVQELNKDDLFVVSGEDNGFYSVEPSPDTKAFVFRGFIIDGLVEGNRVNVRLEPDMEAPIIGHLSKGDKVEGTVCALNNKWMEIEVPSNVKFYIAKDFVEKIGGPEFKIQHDKRRMMADQILETTALLSKAELAKPFEEVDVEKLTHTYTAFINEYGDFPGYVEQATEALVQLQENYLQKKISHLEQKSKTLVAKEGAKIVEEQVTEDKEQTNQISASDRMKFWAPIEEALYLTAINISEQQMSMDEFYEDQKLSAVLLEGILESYNTPVKNKPGNYIVRNDSDLPIAYVYSTCVDLQNMEGKKVKLLGSPRNNNNFAYPAYFVLSAEQ